MDNNKKMDRHDFLRRTGTGLCACAAMVCPGIDLIKSAVEDSKHETPIGEKVKRAQRWVKRFLETLDSQLDEPARKNLMEANGKRCYQQAHTIPDHQIELEKLVLKIQDRNGKENCRLDGNSAGYVREMFESLTGKNATVEILETIKRGGKGCKFKVTYI